MINDRFLTGKSILYLTPPFFEYPLKIKDAIEKQGGNVTLNYFNIKTKLSTLLLNTNQSLYKKYRRKQELEILKNNKNKNFDYILIQHPYFLSHFFLQGLKRMHSESYFINYNWDSLKTGNYLKYAKYFDKILSFDRNDVYENPQIKYLPLFYTNDFSNIRKNFKQLKYDIVFIGMIGVSEKRFEFIKKIQQICDMLGLKFYKYLYMSWNSYLKNEILIKKRFLTGIKHRKLKLREIANIYSLTKVVLDYNNPLQSGLTMRTFEALGSGRKLITTNKNIIKEPFFDPTIIKVIDISNPKIDLDFFNNNVSSKEILDYSIDNWVLKIFYG